MLFGVFDDRDAVWQGLLDRGVLIRNTGPTGWLRVTVGTPAENDAFKQALTEECYAMIVPTRPAPPVPASAA